MAMRAREALLQLLDELPEDYEPETPEERAAVEEALRDLREGRTVPHAEVVRRWGSG
jgi:predicted transcriptional regulator